MRNFNKATSSQVHISGRLTYLTCQLKNADNSLQFFAKNYQDYLITYSLKCVITQTQSTFLPSHQTMTSVFNFLLSFIRLLGNKQLMDEVEHDIMNYQSRGMSFLPKPKAEADITQNLNSLILLSYII